MRRCRYLGTKGGYLFGGPGAELREFVVDAAHGAGDLVTQCRLRRLRLFVLASHHFDLRMHLPDGSPRRVELGAHVDAPQGSERVHVVADRELEIRDLARDICDEVDMSASLMGSPFTSSNAGELERPCCCHVNDCKGGTIRPMGRIVPILLNDDAISLV